MSDTPTATDPPDEAVPEPPRPFRYDGEVRPVETCHLRYEVGETYHGAPDWFLSTGESGDKAWLRADAGGLVDMHWGPYPFVHEGETICTVTDHFREEERVVEAPFTGLVVGSRPPSRSRATRSVTSCAWTASRPRR